MAFVEFADVSKIYQMGEVEVAAVRDNSWSSWGLPGLARRRF